MFRPSLSRHAASGSSYGGGCRLLLIWYFGTWCSFQKAVIPVLNQPTGPQSVIGSMRSESQRSSMSPSIVLSTPTDTLTTSCRPSCTFIGELFKDGICCFPHLPDHICSQGYLISCPTAQTGRKPPCPCSLFTGHCPPLKGPGPTTGTTPPERSSGLVVHGLEWEGKVVVDVTASQLVPREFIHWAETDCCQNQQKEEHPYPQIVYLNIHWINKFCVATQRKEATSCNSSFTLLWIGFLGNLCCIVIWKMIPSRRMPGRLQNKFLPMTAAEYVRHQLQLSPPSFSAQTTSASSWSTRSSSTLLFQLNLLHRVIRLDPQYLQSRFRT